MVDRSAYSQQERYREIIRASVSVRDAVEAYAPGIRFSAHGRIPCPFHNGTDNNCAIYDGGYHCFVCGASGDVFSMTEHLLNCDFRTALFRLNTDFRLNLPIDHAATLKEQNDLDERFSKFLADRRAENERMERLKERYWTLVEKWIGYDKAIRENAPVTATEGLNDAFIEAMKNIRQVEYELDEIEGEKWQIATKR